MDDRRPAQAGAQNPAYRPAHPPSYGLDLRRSITRGSGRAHSGHMCLRAAEGAIERVTRAAGGLRDQVTVKVDSGRDRLMAEPAGNF